MHYTKSIHEKLMDRVVNIVAFAMINISIPYSITVDNSQSSHDEINYSGLQLQ